MTLFYVSILFMVVMVVAAVLPLAVTIAYDARRHLVTPAEIAGAATSVRRPEEAESELLARAEAAARVALEEVEQPASVGEHRVAA